MRRNCLITNNSLDCSDKSCLNAACFKNIFNHISSCCLSLSSCYTNCKQLFIRIAIDCCRHKCKRKPCVICANNCCLAILSFVLAIKNNNYRCLILNLVNILMSITHSTLNAYKCISILHFS